MKRTLLALAVLGAFASAAQAQTNVSIGGVVQANLKSYSVGNTARVTQRELRVDDDYNSRFWLTGSEDLGGGNSAIFYVENRFNTDQRQSAGSGIGGPGAAGAGLADGDTWVGIRGSWGQLTVGKHSWMVAQGLVTEMQMGNGSLSAMPTSMLGTFNILSSVGGVGFGGYLDVTRRANSITYRSPNFNGFTGTVGISTASAGAEGVINGTPYYSDGKEWYLQGNYTNGPLYLNLAYRNHEAEGRTGVDNKQVRLSGSYKFGGFKVGLQYDRATNTTIVANVAGASMSRNAWQLPLSYAFGNHTILASYTRAGDFGGVADTGARMYTIGWDYALSKRTNVGVYYSKLSNDAAAAYQPFLSGTSFTGSGLLAGESASTLALGIKHTF